MGVWGAVEADITFHHNLIVGATGIEQADGTPIVIGVWQTAVFPSGSTEPLKLYNNTIVECPRAFQLDANNVTLKNNISEMGTLTANRHILDENAPSVSKHVRDSNCYYDIAINHTIQWGGTTYDGSTGKTWSNYVTDSGQEGDSINEDPDLDAAFELQSTSPVECRRFAEPIWPEGTLDLNGNPLPAADQSMGAFQFDDP